MCAERGCGACGSGRVLEHLSGRTRGLGMVRKPSGVGAAGVDQQVENLLVQLRTPMRGQRLLNCAPGDLVPTWNHVTAHLYGTPEILSDEENYAILNVLTDHFEGHRPDGRSLREDEEGTRRIAKGTVGLRMRVTRFDARAKLSQNKAPDVVANVIAHLEPGNPDLAAEMRRTHGGTAS